MEASPADSGVGKAANLRGLLDAGAAWLRRRGIDEPRLKLEWLASSVLGAPRTELPLSKVPSEDALMRLREGLARLGAGEPVQYVAGDWDFRMLTLKVDRRALIPRPETEQLVQQVLDEEELWREGHPNICDIGTGTGAIALSLAFERPSCSVVAVDCSEAALALARENRDALGFGDDRVRLVMGKGSAGAPPASFDAVVSNPPYIPSATVQALPPAIRDYEPHMALDGGKDGLDALRGIVADAAISLKKGGFLFLEIGEDQGRAVWRLMEDAGFSRISVAKDYNGFDRFAKGRID